MIPLSKAVMRMSTYDRTNQELDWYEEPIYLCTTEWNMAEKIGAECRRRKIPFYKDENLFCVYERSKDKRKVPSEGVINDRQKYDKYPDERLNYYVLKIKLDTWKTTTLERKQLADWAITTFNDEEGPIFPDDLISYGVWVQPSGEVTVDRDSYDEDGMLRTSAEHWVHDMDGMPRRFTVPWLESH